MEDRIVRCVKRIGQCSVERAFLDLGFQSMDHVNSGRVANGDFARACNIGINLHGSFKFYIEGSIYQFSRSRHTPRVVSGSLDSIGPLT